MRGKDAEIISENQSNLEEKFNVLLKTNISRLGNGLMGPFDGNKSYSKEYLPAFINFIKQIRHTLEEMYTLLKILDEQKELVPTNSLRCILKLWQNQEEETYRNFVNGYGVFSERKMLADNTILNDVQYLMAGSYGPLLCELYYNVREICIQLTAFLEKDEVEKLLDEVKKEPKLDGIYSNYWIFYLAQVKLSSKEKIPANCYYFNYITEFLIKDLSIEESMRYMLPCMNSLVALTPYQQAMKDYDWGRFHCFYYLTARSPSFAEYVPKKEPGSLYAYYLLGLYHHFFGKQKSSYLPDFSSSVVDPLNDLQALISYQFHQQREDSLPKDVYWCEVDRVDSAITTSVAENEGDPVFNFDNKLTFWKQKEANNKQNSKLSVPRPFPSVCNMAKQDVSALHFQRLVDQRN